MALSNSWDLLSLRNDTFVREIDYHEVIGSTNDRAIEMARTDCETPLLVIADQQSAGRGRGANQWWSATGALTFSLILDLPMLAPERLSSFSLTVGLAVCQALEKFAPAADLALKWPNDVYLNAKKVSGILIDRPVASESRLIVGVGVNINNSLKDAPAELASRATSLSDELDAHFELTATLIEVLNQIESRMRDHIHRAEWLLDQYRAYCMLTGRTVTIEVGSEIVTGRCKGIDVSGALLIENGGGLQKCVAGVIQKIS